MDKIEGTGAIDWIVPVPGYRLQSYMVVLERCYASILVVYSLVAKLYGYSFFHSCLSI